MATPKWMDQVQGVDFSAEKSLLKIIAQWGKGLGLTVLSGRNLPYDLASTSDLVLAKGNNLLRVEVKRKSRTVNGKVNVEGVPSFKRVLLVWSEDDRDWKLTTESGVSFDKPWNDETFAWVVGELIPGK